MLGKERVKSRFKKKIATAVIVSVFAGIGFGLGAHFYVLPTYYTYQAQKELNEKINSLKKGSVKAYFAKIEEFKGEAIEGTTPKQVKLATKIKGSFDKDGAVFEFFDKESVEKYGISTLDLFIDFSNVASRDFLAVNSPILERFIKTEGLVVRVHPIPNNHPMSMLIPEAVAQSIAEDSSLSWNFMVKLNKNTKGFETDDSISLANSIASEVDEFGYKISAKSILHGAYSSWIYENSKNETLKLKSAPIIIFGITPLTDESVVIHDPESFASYLSKSIKENRK